MKLIMVKYDFLKEHYVIKKGSLKYSFGYNDNDVIRRL